MAQFGWASCDGGSDVRLINGPVHGADRQFSKKR